MSEQQAQAIVDQARAAGCIAWVTGRPVFHSGFRNRMIWGVRIERQPNV